MTNDLPPEFLARLEQITAKRARTVIDHILQHGQITSEDLREIYGYNHPPRAIRDVREEGIPIVTFRTTSSDGRSIAAYRFGDPSDIQNRKLGGRKTFSKSFREQLLASQGNRCAICNTPYENRYLQIDHRVPYEIKGDDNKALDESEYMLVCMSCNRAKSWSCEHCDNWYKKDVAVCRRCYWASPHEYEHIALLDERRLDLSWQGDEAEIFEAMRSQAEKSSQSLQDYIKLLLKKALGR